MFHKIFYRIPLIGFTQMPTGGISSTVIAELGKGRSVTTDILLKICDALDCDFADIMEVDRSEEGTK